MSMWDTNAVGHQVWRENLERRVQNALGPIANIESITDLNLVGLLATTKPAAEQFGLDDPEDAIAQAKAVELLAPFRKPT